MIWMMLTSVLTGACMVGSALCILFNEILLSPSSPNYPTAPKRLRIGMFVMGLVLLYGGVEVITAATLGDHPKYVRVFAPLLMGLWFYVTATQFEKTLRQWLPVRVQRRVQQLWDFASCKHERELRQQREKANKALRPGVSPGPEKATSVGSALAELSLAGGIVIGPNEGPSAVVEQVTAQAQSKMRVSPRL